MRRRLFPYPISLAVVVAALIAITGGWVAWWNYRAGVQNVRNLAGDLFAQTAREAAQRAEAFLATAPPAAETLSGLATLDATEPDTDALARRFLAVLAANPNFKWVSYSRSTGEFIGVYRTKTGTRVNHSVIRDGATVLDELDVQPDGTWKPARHEDDTKYDPRTRPFYTLSAAADHGVWTPPYVFAENVPGITYALAVRHGGELAGVLTIDFDLAGLSALARELQFSEHGRVAIVASDGVVIAHPTEAVVGKAAELVHIEDVADLAHTRDASYMTRSLELGVPAGAPWRVIAYAPESDFTSTMRGRIASSLLISGVAVLVAVAIAWLLARRISGPLTTLADQMVRVGDLQLDDPAAPPTVFREIDMMHTALARMTTGLRSFARYVPRDLVRTLLANGQSAELAGELRELTIYFSDLAGFTSLAETRRPDELVKFLGEYFDDMSTIIAAERGTVDKYLGDGIMAFWGAPVELVDHATRACAAALRCQRRVRELAARGVALATRIGIASGQVLVGNIGSTERLNYTVMGDVANLASRLEGLNKQYGTDLMISQATHDAARDQIVARPLDVVAVKGKQQGVRVYELLAMRSEGNQDAEAIADASSRALTAYLERRFDAAIAAWDEVLARRPDDKAARVMRQRAELLAVSPPPADWTGVTIATEK